MHQYLPVCKVVTTHGVRGEMKAQILCDDIYFLAEFDRLFETANGGGERDLLTVRAQGTMALIRLSGIEDMDTARAMVGKTLYISREDIDLPEGRFMVDDLLGLPVIDADTGVEYGKLTDVDHPGAQDIYTVTAKDGTKYLMPAVDAFVKEIDPKGGKILVTPIPGLFGDAVNGDE